MNNTQRFAAILLSSALTYGVANAETLYGPMQGNTLQFADHAVSIYYTEKGNDFEVVTTVGANSSHSYLFRIVTDLADNKQHSIAIGGYGDNNTNATLTLSRVGNEIQADIEAEAQPVPGEQKLTLNLQ